MKRGRTQKKSKQLKMKMNGGFIPSIMEGFCGAVSKYITPITLVIIHRMMEDRKTRHKRNRKKRSG